VISAKDSFFLFLHWIRSVNPIDQIAAHCDLRPPALYKHFHKLALAVHDLLVTKYITDLREQPLHVTGSDCRSYGLVVGAMVQKQGRPAASFEEAGRYFSGKHWIYCLKSQVVTNRQSLALHVVAGVPGSVHDIALFRSTVTELEELMASTPNEPTKTLADKEYIDSQIHRSCNSWLPTRNRGMAF
jgi:AcrR family transcriptional regulator